MQLRSLHYSRVSPAMIVTSSLSLFFVKAEEGEELTATCKLQTNLTLMFEMILYLFEGFYCWIVGLEGIKFTARSFSRSYMIFFSVYLDE